MSKQMFGQVTVCQQTQNGDWAGLIQVDGLLHCFLLGPVNFRAWSTDGEEIDVFTQEMDYVETVQGVTDFINKLNLAN